VLVERLAAVVSTEDPPERVVSVAREVIATLTEAERIAILNAHPRIGADVRALSDLSRAEQGTDADADTLRELAELNEAYERKFGFRFVVFVAGRRKRDVVPALRSRLERSRDVELATAIEEFLRIAGARLENETT